MSKRGQNQGRQLVDQFDVYKSPVASSINKSGSVKHGTSKASRYKKNQKRQLWNNNATESGINRSETFSSDNIGFTGPTLTTDTAIEPNGFDSDDLLPPPPPIPEPSARKTRITNISYSKIENSNDQDRDCEDDIFSKPPPPPPGSPDDKRLSVNSDDTDHLIETQMELMELKQTSREFKIPPAPGIQSNRQNIPSFEEQEISVSRTYRPSRVSSKDQSGEMKYDPTDRRRTTRQTMIHSKPTSSSSKSSKHLSKASSNKASSQVKVVSIRGSPSSRNSRRAKISNVSMMEVTDSPTGLSTPFPKLSEVFLEDTILMDDDETAFGFSANREPTRVQPVSRRIPAADLDIYGPAVPPRPRRKKNGANPKNNLHL